jgi:hypothetical protein
MDESEDWIRKLAPVNAKSNLSIEFVVIRQVADGVVHDNHRGIGAEEYRVHLRNLAGSNETEISHGRVSWQTR